MIAYEQLLNDSTSWALQEGSMHFENQSAVHKALRKIAGRLGELHIPYALVGGMALFLHGYRRFTEDVDLLVTAEGLQQIHRDLVGRGYVPSFSGSRNLRDAELGVRIKLIVTGANPGDGLPKAVAFPSPQDASVEIDSVRCLSLARLIELKLASGTAPGRLRDLADVQELIRVLKLPTNFSEQLDPSVRESFAQMWNAVRSTPPAP